MTEIRKETRYSATWLPIAPVSLGDVGRLNGYQYVPVTTLKDLGFSFDVEKGTVNADIDYYSKGAVSSEVKLAGRTPPPGSPLVHGKVGVTLSFKRAGAIVFAASGCRSNRIRDNKSLGDIILQRFHDGLWERDLVVVTEVVSASTATILVASSAGAQVDLVAEGKVTTPSVSLADASARFYTASSRAIGFNVIGGKNLTPLFRAGGIKRTFLRRASFRGAALSAAAEKAVFGELDYADFA